MNASPRKRQSVAELRELQRLAFSAIQRPLAPGARMRRTWEDGRLTREVVAGFIKPNDRLTSLERLEIYNKQYWFRLLDCLYDDYPGLRAILGERKFYRLRVAYLQRHPSRSFTMRNLGSSLEEFLRDEPHWLHPHEEMGMDMARFEWAQVVAFDEREEPPLVPDDLLGRDPANLRLGLQPHLTLLEMGYPLDDFVIAVKKEVMRTEASNAAADGAERHEARPRRFRPPRPQKTWLGVYRYENGIDYKRLEREALRLLEALRDGATVADACTAALAEAGDDRDWAQQIQKWFALWTELGWLCKAAPVGTAARPSGGES